MSSLNQFLQQFTAATLSKPQENGRYQVIVKTASIYQGGTFVTLLDYRGGTWQVPAGYYPLQILAWKKDD